MKLMLNNLEKSIFLLFVTLLSHISARAFPTPAHGVIILISPLDSHADVLHSHYGSNSDHDELSHHRQRRASYYPSPQYGSYYDGPAEESVHRRRPSRYNGPSRLDDGYNAIKRQEFVGPEGPPPPAPGNKYVYQPLFKYKSTNHKHHKLFVPNLFG